MHQVILEDDGYPKLFEKFKNIRFDIDKIDIKLPPKNDFGDMQERRIDFSVWANRETDKNKMYNHILNFIKQSSQKTLVSKNKIKLIESRITK